jgi:hypothetical protein
MACTVHCATVKLALIMGNNRGLLSEQPLTYAEHDAEQVFSILTSLGGIEKDRSYLILNQNRDQIETAFHEIIGRVKEIKRTETKVVLFMYYSGHGSPGYFHVNGKKLSLSQIREWFSSTDVDFKVFIADACFSGSLLETKGGTIAPPVTITTDDTLNTSGAVILTSSSGAENAHELKRLQGSLFTFHLLCGLRGAADYDKNHLVSLLEVINYTGTQTKAAIAGSAIQQHPVFNIDMAGTSDLVLSQLEKAGVLLTLTSCDGLYSVIDEQTMNIKMEISLHPKDTITLALDQGRYQVRQICDDRILSAAVDLTWQKSKTVRSADFKPFPVDAFVRKGSIKYQAHSITGGALVLKGLPESIWIIPEIAYVLSLFKTDIRIGAGFTRSVSLGNNLCINRKIAEASAELRYHLINRARYRITLLSRFQYLFMHQDMDRENEDQILSAGYQPLPVYNAHVPGLFPGCGMSALLPAGLILSINIYGGVFGGRDLHDSYVFYPRGMGGAWIGKSF